jgi:hypothetical protein
MVKNGRMSSESKIEQEGLAPEEHLAVLLGDQGETV